MDCHISPFKGGGLDLEFEMKDMTLVLKVQCIQVTRKKKKLQRLLLSKRCRVQDCVHTRVK